MFWQCQMNQFQPAAGNFSREPHPRVHRAQQHTGVEVEPLRIDQMLQYVALLLEILRLAQHGNQLLHLGVLEVGLRGGPVARQRLNVYLWHCDTKARY